MGPVSGLQEGQAKAPFFFFLSTVNGWSCYSQKDVFSD